MKTPARGFIGTLILIIIALAIAGGAYILYTQHTQSGSKPAHEDRLIGTWVQTDNPDRALGVTDTLTFNSDGTFSTKNNGTIDQFTSKSVGAPYASPASATTTGLWSIVSNPASEVVNPNDDPTQTPIHLPGVPTGALVLKEIVNFHMSPWYFSLITNPDGTITLNQLLIGGGTWTYKKS